MIFMRRLLRKATAKPKPEQYEVTEKSPDLSSKENANWLGWLIAGDPPDIK